ncbi:site-specific integrase [Rhodococcus sp. H29-C3]|uniref:tyrosine-type recombinase/integrase n=1 Tax=Rhodococcus sp. H29-C3 TaxID=3046307 RepID=UPI0024B888C6|nr:site-specific integrase [Rhodococcus sp. H29-C3]MDJ0363467.1 site-specific integrase [Rhodococcus sp. H29-C3]
MTAVELATELAAVQHVDRATYRKWLWINTTPGSRYSRLAHYDEFIARWPQLSEWFAAPLAQRTFDVDEPVAGQHPHGGANVIMPYLSYLSLVHGIGLDYDLLFARTFAGPFTDSAAPTGLGIDLGLFDSHVNRLAQLGYTADGAKTDLKSALGRLILHRGDPDLAAITAADIKEMRCAGDVFTERLRYEPIREFYSRSRGNRLPADPVETFRRSVATRLNAAHLLLFTIGQVNTEPPGRIDAGSWTAHLTPVKTPPLIRAVVDRYLKLHLEASLGREQSVRHFRDALRRLVLWLCEAHPEVENLDQLTREHAEEFLRWLGEQTSQQTGLPLAVSTRRSIVTLLARFVSDTASWGWEDVPGRVLFARGDIPRITKTVPRFIPDHELAALMNAVEQLPDPYQRAALIVARWSGARRDEIRRLALDCLDTYPDGHPRLRIPVGKGYSERSIPLHPDAAAALQPLIELAHNRGARGRYDISVGRAVEHIFTYRGRLLSPGFLFDLSLKAACTAAGMVDSQGRPTVSAHRFRHTIGTQLAEGGARLQTIMAVLGHRTPHMSLIYSSLSDPIVKQQYQDALDRHLDGVVLAGPAAQALREHRLEPEAVSWLQTNFLKTELELGHCLRLPQEGPCECDLVLTCSKFLTTSDYAPRLRTRLVTERTLIADAVERGWDKEAERHERTVDRITGLLADLGQEPEPIQR